MVDLVPLLAPAISRLADEAQQALGALGSILQGARLVAEPRQYAGQLGSHFSAALQRSTSARHFSAAPQRGAEPPAAVQPGLARGHRAHLQLHRRVALADRAAGLLIELQLRLALPEPAMQAPWQRVHAQHFQQAQGLIAQVIAASNADGCYGMAPAGFAARWCW